MQTYHKINTLFKRDMANKGKMIHGSWSTPELEYLANNEWEFTEKVDGTNIRIGWEMCKHPEFAGRTDNAVIPKALKEYLHDTFSARLFVDALEDDLDSKSIPVILHGEGYGPKIQGGGKYREDHSFVLFDVQMGDWWLKREAVDDIADKLGIKSVPVIGYGTLQDAIDIVSTGFTFNKQGAIARYGRKGLDSTWGEFEAEGIVARPKVAMFDRRGDRIICKIKAVDFK